ncbi:hypothetical protein C4577_03400 [Candidatus Parcubacteria bacterium]|nr:MAG: hypothetical protein C4577_03400 [Candidatus Parcubacteria bacterium]
MGINKTNVCTRCGKERIDAKTWTETLQTFYGETQITYTDTVCPNAECQKIVEKHLEIQKQKSMAILAAKEERARNAQNNRKKKV